MLGNGEDQKRRMRRNIGLSLLGIGLGGPLALHGRQLLKVRKALKAMQGDALKSTKDVDRYVKRHLASVGKTLPEYKWSNLADIKRRGTLGKGPVLTTQSVKIPVYTSIDDLMNGVDHVCKNSPSMQKFLEKLVRRLSGPHIDPHSGYVYLGKHLSPKALLHELGHAQDALNGKLFSSDRGIRIGSLKNWWNNLKNPDSTGLLQGEIRAWDNGGIAAGDKVREAALDTYRNAVRNKMLTPVFHGVALPGAYMTYTNRDKSKKK